MKSAFNFIRGNQPDSSPCKKAMFVLRAINRPYGVSSVKLRDHADDELIQKMKDGGFIEEILVRQTRRRNETRIVATSYGKTFLEDNCLV